MISKEAIIFGETKIVIDCMEYLLNKSWNINAVVTRDSNVNDWCQKELIKCLTIDQAFQITKCGYLFSIINPYIISKRLLNQISPVHAINYHDSLLPRYAGINSTTWAILNNEKFHGVSWHEITAEIDEGDIYYQAKIPIDVTDTAFSLNLKCTQAALSGFVEIIDSIEQNKLVGVKQNLSEKTYFGRDYIPTNYGYLNSSNSLSQINNMLNSLSFGDGYLNNVATAKIKLNNKSYILEKKIPQRCIDKINLSDFSNYTLRNLYGKREQTNDLDFSKLEQCILDIVDINELRQIKQKEFYIYNKLNKILNHHAIEAKSGLFISELQSNIKNELELPLNLSIDILCLFLSIILNRFTINRTFVKVYHGLTGCNKSIIVNELVETISIIDVNIDDLGLSYDGMSQKIINAISNNFELVKDFGYRYLINLCSEFAVTDNYSANVDDHRILFCINPGKILIKFYKQDNNFIKILIKSIKVLYKKHNKLSYDKTQIKNISLLSNAEYTKVIKTWNNTNTIFEAKTIHSLFEEQVLKTPNDIAIIYEDKKLTYHELNENSNQLAHYLRNKYHIVSDDIIALCLSRNEYIIIAILAVLKSGAAYVPIDYNFPKTRIGYILRDTKTRIILTDFFKQTLLEILENILSMETDNFVNTEIESINEIECQNTLNKATYNLVSNTTSRSLAYIMYTSGTSGIPKGVMVEHASVLNIIKALQNVYDTRLGKRMCAFTSYTFDVSVSEFFTSLLKGGELHILSDKIRMNAISVSNYIIEHKINYAYLPPALLSQIPKENFPMLLGLIYAGEPCNKNTGIYWSNKIKLYNYYGPTETSIYAIGKQIINGDVNLIGKPIPNIQVYILDNSLLPIPVGCIGELYIGGIGLARGYLNNPELTKEFFIDNPFQSKSEKKQNINARLYKTRDLVRYLPDGNLEYIGRNDSQVKIHGYRIELSEIETVLMMYPEIKESVVLVKEHFDSDGVATENKYLVAYYVSKCVLNEAIIRNHLANNLPDYMMPHTIIWIEKMPLTINGKLDKKLLLSSNFFEPTTYVPPQNELETTICNLFSEVLQINKFRIGIHDDFFELGGNSISAIKLVGMLNNLFHSLVKAVDVYAYKTIANIANLVKSTRGSFPYEKYLITASDTVNLYQPFDLNNVQQAYYFGRIDGIELGNISTHIYSELIFNNLDTLKLEKAFNKLIERHLGLRTIFVNGQQQYLEHVPEYKIIFHECNNEKEILTVRNALSHKIYQANTFPLFDFIISKYDNRYILHISFDALLMDGNSHQILFHELGILYNNINANLPILTVTYRDYITQFMQIRQSNLFNLEKKYWLDKLDEYNFSMSLPLQCQAYQVLKPTFKRISKIIDKEIWRKIEDRAKLNNISSTSLILNVYARVLSYWTNQNKLCINLTLFNRLPLHSQINDIIGDFTSLELFNYQQCDDHIIITELKDTHQRLWNDIEHNLFDGIDFQRLIRKELKLPNNQIIAPIVLTSMLGSKTIFSNNALINDSYQGVNYSITQTSQLWIDNKAYETKDGFVAEWDYVEQLFEHSTIEDMHSHYCYLIEYLSDADWSGRFPDFTLPNLDLKLINTANSALQSISSDTLFGFCESYIASNQLLNNLAVIDNINAHTNHEYNYAQLLNESRLFAKYICSLSIRTNKSQLIAILSEKGYNQVVASFSIMKSGYGYIPLNIEWPVSRIEEILVQANVTIVLISKQQSANIEVNRQLSNIYQLVVIEDVLENIGVNKKLKNKLEKTSLPSVTSDDIAYVIFTSGSTGIPKGVTISHRGALNTILAVNNKFQVTQEDKVFALSELSFDLSVYDIFGLLAVGGTIIFPNQNDTKSPVRWLELIDKYKVTIWNTVPQLASLLIDSANARNTAQSLRLFLLSGDWIPINLPKLTSKILPAAKIISLGGATEGSIWSIWYEITNVSWNKIPYGIAMPNQKMYVLNDDLEHIPIGVIGEIYIGGVGVALNYWENDAATKQSFILHHKFGRIYKTGDLGRWHKNGYIEFMGRNDNQVKLNGYRVELGEIENKIINYPGIKHAIALIKENPNQKNIDNKSIIAYYVSKKSVDETSLHNYLATQLPSYMIPHALVHINKLPLTKNGKLDNRALPKINFSAASANQHISPRNDLEQQVCEIYADILGLKTNEVGVTDDFFMLGGNSILAIKLANKLSTSLNINVDMATLFKNKTIVSILEQVKANTTEPVIIPKYSVPKNQGYPLSFAQERLWFIEEYERGSNAYNIPLVEKINSGIDLSTLKQAISSIVARHDVLHSFIKTDNSGNGYQVVGDLTVTPLMFNEYTVSTDVELSSLINRAVNHIYKLNEEYPIRVSIFSKRTKTHEQYKHYISIVIHHIAFDGWSINLFLDELEKYYNYYCEQTLGKDTPLINLPDLSIQYKDFAIWQRNYLTADLLKEQLSYWSNKLEGYEILNLPLDKVRPTQISYIGDDIPFTLTETTSNKLRNLAKSLNVSLYSLLLSGYYVLLSSYSNQDDIVLGIPVTSRRHPQLENLIGLFLNNLALRIKITKSNSLISYIKAISKQIIEAQLYQDIPFEKLVTELNIPKDTSRHPIFQAMFTIQSLSNMMDDHGEVFKPYHGNEYKIARFDITTFIDDSQERLGGVFNYATSLFNRETILNFIKTYACILEQIADVNSDSQMTVGNLNYLTKEDYQKVLCTWNQTAKNYPHNRTIHQLFEEQVIRTPDSVAVIYENIKLTYKELNTKANQLAHYLQKTYHIQGDDLITLYLDRSEYMLITILATLKSGAAYVPMDPSFPDKRINHILKDTKTKVIITNEVYHDKLTNILSSKTTASDIASTNKEANSQIACELCLIDSIEFQMSLGKFPTTNLPQSITNHNLAYVIYTSGTTGAPTGVMIEHDQIVTFIYSLTDALKKLGDQSFNMLSTTNYVFDIFGLEYLLPLSNGNYINIANNNFLDQSDAIQMNKYNYIQLTPSKIEPLLSRTAYEKSSHTHTITLLVGGETLGKNDVELIKKYELQRGNIQFKIINVYGPTETTIWSTISLIDNSDMIFIGKPIPNETAYVLDTNLNPLPIGAIGELYIGGTGLARMYLNHPKLTEEHFIANPHQSLEDKEQHRNTRLYKTGDLVRYLPDGNLEYLGRNDSQVKIRGFRIELKEIETTICNHPGIQQSVVVVNESKGNKHIIAYYVSKSKLDEGLLSDYMARQLPEYMIPNAFVHTNKIPLTINGKIDRQALLLLSFENNDNYVAPNNIAELKICTIYSEVLNLSLDQVGVNHDFFRLGGNSILAINLLYRLQQEFKINLNDIFKLKTPARIAKLVPFTKNSLYHKLKQIKSVYDRLSSYKKENNPEMKRKKMIYLQQVEQIKFTNKSKNIHSVLLTGSTGHLGCHLLYQLLFKTNYKIYLPVRAESDSVAYDRVEKKFKFYFDIGLSHYQDRIVTIAADIEKSNLNLSHNKYKELVSGIDSVIHSAALVKHYGDQTTFYQANVQTTINLLELAKLTRLKDFHYISTLSVLTSGYIPNHHYYIFTEYDSDIMLKNNNNVYIQTKYESELITVKSRAFGVNSNIYRVGNLSMNSKNYRNQENIEENAFFARVKTILDIGMIPKEIAQVEVSPVDYTALAIVNLFDKADLSNQVYHVANTHICDLSKLFAQCNDVNVKIVSFEIFIDAVLARLNNKINREQIERFMLHQMWLEDTNLNQLTQINVLQDKTNAILSKLNFSWPHITANMISDLISRSISGENKMKKKDPIFEYLESIAELIPAPFYWLDVTGKCLGLNALSRKAVGAATKEDIIGKSVYEFYQDVIIAKEIQQYIDEVIKTGVSSIQEDKVIDITTGKFKYFSSTRAPLRNKKGEIIGLVGTAIEITAEKEAERLKLENERLELENKAHQLEKEAEHLRVENEANKAALAQKEAEELRLRVENEANKASLAEKEKLIALKEAERLKFENEALQAAAKEQEKFRKVVRQLGHDINSPKTSIDFIVNQLSSNISEEDRIVLRNASEGIAGISQRLLSQYDDQTLASGYDNLLVSLVLVQIVNEKRVEHRNTNVVFEIEIGHLVNFTVIRHNFGEFKRMISNLVNNAVDALKGRADGKITVRLGNNLAKAIIFVKDNGPGMPKHIQDKFFEGIAVTEGKENGHGVGLTQVSDAIKAGNGKCTIDANDNGTTFTIRFPIVPTPDWIAMEIKLTKDDTIVILDDDQSIHGIWDNIFKSYLEKVSTLQVKHFTQGAEVISYINGLTIEQKQDTCLLTDYELLGQDVNGLDVVAQTNMRRAILVTSYSANSDIQNRVTQAGIKMLPKELAAAAKIVVDQKLEKWSKKVDIVWVEDSKQFIDGLILKCYSHLKVDVFYDPVTFMEYIIQYPLDTRIILDTFYKSADGTYYRADGFALAHELHEMGYTKLILFAGEPPEGPPPPYLQVVLKSNLDAIDKLDKV